MGSGERPSLERVERELPAEEAAHELGRRSRSPGREHFVRVSFRGGYGPAPGYGSIGFRCVGEANIP